MPDSQAKQPKKRSSRFGDILSILGEEVPAEPPEPEPFEEETEPEAPALEPPAPAPEPAAEAAKPEPPAKELTAEELVARVLRPEPELQTPGQPAPVPEPVAEAPKPGPVPEAIKPEPGPAAVPAPEPPAQEPSAPALETAAEAPKPEPPEEAAPPEPKAEPPQSAPAAPQQDTAIVDRLLADFAVKNAEILRLNNELGQLQFELKDKDEQIAVLEAAEAELKKALEDQIAGKLVTLQEKDAVLAAKDEELRARDVKIREIEAKMNLMSEQFGVLRKLTSRESSHEPFDATAATAPGEVPEADEADPREQMPPEEEDVASIFMRLAGAKPEEKQGEEEGGDGSEKPPRKPRSPKLYDL